MRAEQRQEQVVVLAEQPRIASRWPPTASSRLSTPNSMPSLATVAPTSAAAPQQLSGGLDRLLAEHGHGTWLDDARLVGGDRRDRVAEVLRRGRSRSA